MAGRHCASSGVAESMVSNATASCSSHIGVARQDHWASAFVVVSACGIGHVIAGECQIVGRSLMLLWLSRLLFMKSPLREAGLVVRALAAMLEDDDGLARRDCRLHQDGPRQARRLRAEVIHAQAIRCSGPAARRLARPEVQ